MAKPQELAIGLVVPENEMATGSPSPSKTRPTEVCAFHGVEARTRAQATDRALILRRPAPRREVQMKYQHARLLISGKTPSDLLADHIRDQATVMPNNILKVNSFLNHQVDCHLMHVCGHGASRASATAHGRRAGAQGVGLARWTEWVMRWLARLRPCAAFARAMPYARRGSRGRPHGGTRGRLQSWRDGSAGST